MPARDLGRAADGAAGPRTPTKPVGASDGSEAEDVRDHGEQTEGGEREDELIGTSGSHTPEADLRAEEPFGEIASSADTEGGVD